MFPRFSVWLTNLDEGSLVLDARLAGCLQCMQVCSGPFSGPCNPLCALVGSMDQFITNLETGEICWCQFETFLLSNAGLRLRAHFLQSFMV